MPESTEGVSEASIYYAEYGNLDIPRRYKTPMGLSLGAWLQIQRQVRSGKRAGSLTQQQIERLDSIGMRWDNYSDLAWTKGYEEATQYYASVVRKNITVYISPAFLQLHGDIMLYFVC